MVDNWRWLKLKAVLIKKLFDMERKSKKLHTTIKDGARADEHKKEEGGTSFEHFHGFA